MNKTLTEARVYVEKIRNLLLNIHGTDIIFCPPFTALFGINDLLGGTPARLGAQNCHWEANGAMTGEVSLDMLLDLGVEFVILGHSERRHIFKEPDEWINRKVISAFKAGIRPILCIGETIDERERGDTNEILQRQLREGLKGIDRAPGLIVAYEPVWAIGTGLTADQEQVQAAHDFVRNELRKIFREDEGNVIPILYGGSVKPGNAGELFSVENVNGFLVGGASLIVEDFIGIINKVENS